jgi:hypothetical protein
MYWLGHMYAVIGGETPILPQRDSPSVLVAHFPIRAVTLLHLSAIPIFCCEPEGSRVQHDAMDVKRQRNTSVLGIPTDDSHRVRRNNANINVLDTPARHFFKRAAI